VQVFGRASVVGEQQQAEADLRHEQRLDESQDVREQQPRAPRAEVRIATPDRGQRGRAEHGKREHAVGG
jgi:hypothetical protein